MNDTGKNGKTVLILKGFLLQKIQMDCVKDYTNAGHTSATNLIKKAVLNYLIK